MKKWLRVAAGVLAAALLVSAFLLLRPRQVNWNRYPADFAQWTVRDLKNYFRDAGVFEKRKWIFTQSKAEDYADTYVSAATGYMDDEGQITIALFTFDMNSTEYDMPAVMEELRKSHHLDANMGHLGLDHLVGHVGFWYSATANQEVYEAMDRAYRELVTHMALTPDF